MVGVDDIVITGLGIVSPIGIGRQSVEQNLLNRVCGSKEIFRAESGDPIWCGAPIEDFEGKNFVSPRKALKMMSREVQIAYAAAQLAWDDAQLIDTHPEPDRIGVVYGSEMIPGDIAEVVPAVRACSTGPTIDPALWGSQFQKAIFPLWMLRNLPNMPACHVAIAIDARGPNNTIALEEPSGLLALSEAICIMERDQADMMVVGAVGGRINPTRLLYRKLGAYFNGAQLNAPTEFHSRAFDQQHAGIVPSELSIALIIERRRHAVARGATIYGHVLGTASRCGRPESSIGGSSQSIASAAIGAMELADVQATDLACVSAQGYSQPELDRVEAAAIASFAPNAPVTAFSSYFGTAGAASGLAQLAAGLLAMKSRSVLPILGLNSVAPDCPINACANRQPTNQTHLLQLSFTMQGQSAAVLVDC